ncbi:unnamed protein product, partial [Phaeothamnion confervicola]
VTVNPVPVVSFSGLLPGYCNINTLNTLTGNKPGVTFSGFGVADNGSGVGTFTPKTAFDQQALGSTSPQTIVVTATYTNSQGCAYPITRSFVVRPKP